jgi:hypothetical protein
MDYVGLVNITIPTKTNSPKKTFALEQIKKIFLGEGNAFMHNHANVNIYSESLPNLHRSCSDSAASLTQPDILLTCPIQLASTTDLCHAKIFFSSTF